LTVTRWRSMYPFRLKRRQKHGS